MSEINRTPLSTSPVPRGWRLVNSEEGSIAPTDSCVLGDQLRQQGTHLMAVRHGQSQANARAEAEGHRILCGQVDSPLTPRGQEQAREAAQQVYAQLGGDAWLQQACADPRQLPVIYSGPLSRAQDTARATVEYISQRARELAGQGRVKLEDAQRVGQDLQRDLDARLTEYGFGDDELRPVPQVCQELPDYMRNWDPTEGSGVDFLHRFPNGESRADILERVDAFLHDVANHDAGRTVLMFCHMRTIAAFEEDLGQMPTVDGREREVTQNLGNATPIWLTGPPDSPGG